jgi:hypothetical protein
MLFKKDFLDRTEKSDPESVLLKLGKSRVIDLNRNIGRNRKVLK